MALITFIYLELLELIDMAQKLFPLSGVENLINQLMLFALQFITESMLNFINAFIWWHQWGDRLPISNGSDFYWILASYFRYLIGQQLAKYMVKTKAK